MRTLIMMLGAVLITSKVFVYLFGSIILQLCNRNIDQFECEERVETYIRNHERLFRVLYWLGWAAVLIGGIIKFGLWPGILCPVILWLMSVILSKILRKIMNCQENKRRKARCQASTTSTAAVAPTEPHAFQPFSIKSDLRLLVISDCHSLTEEEAAKLAGLQYDLCFFLGDINENYLTMLLKYIPKEKTYGIHGNHDEYGLLESFNIPNIHLKTIEYNGITILGYEGSHRYKRGAYVMHTQEESQHDLKQAPAADILISHDGPYQLYHTSMSHSGFQGITDYLTTRNLPLNIHGHQHINSHKRHGATDVICIYRAALIDLTNSTIQNIF